MYSWYDVAERTERVYKIAMDVEPPAMVERLRRSVPFFQFSRSSLSGTDFCRGKSYFGTGLFFGKIMCIVICVDFIFLSILAWLCSDDRIDRAPKWDSRKYEELRRAARVEASSNSHSRALDAVDLSNITL
jgi:phosphatidylinositol N-acetylglucosaminyltransferase subunit A